MQSTTQAKYWNNPFGWREIVRFLNDAGYRVVCIDRSPANGQGLIWNHIPHGVQDETGERPLAERARWLMHAEFFVGLSSGLAWLAWAAGVPVVMISGFTHPTNEFATPYRVINYHACNSCWNDVRVRFDHKDYLWCPRHKDTLAAVRVHAADHRRAGQGGDPPHSRLRRRGRRRRKPGDDIRRPRVRGKKKGGELVSQATAQTLELRACRARADRQLLSHRRRSGAASSSARADGPRRGGGGPRPGGQSSPHEVAHPSPRRRKTHRRLPYPAVIQLKDGSFAVLAIAGDKGKVRLVDSLVRSVREVTLKEAEELSSGVAILVGRRLGGAGIDPDTFGFRWFWPSIVRYRRPLTHVLVASLFVQLFGW